MVAPAKSRKSKPSPLSYIRAIWKHKLLLGSVWILVTAAAAVVAYLLPPVYRAEALILVESQRIPESFVPSTVGGDLKDRLTNISQKILSYTRLLEVIRKLNLYQEEQRTLHQEEVVGIMRDNISVELEQGWSRDHPGAFRVAYEGKDPKVVAMVANELGNLFIEENLKTREIQAVGTSEFLDSELTQAKKNLESLEARLSAYKLEHNGELPEQEPALIANMGRLQTQLQGVQDAINRTSQNNVMTENTLKAAEASETTMTEIVKQLSSIETTSSGVTTATEVSAKEIEELERTLRSLRLRYTDQYPMVQSVENLLQRLKGSLQLAQAADPAVSSSGKAGSDGSGDEEAALIARDPKTAALAGALMRERERIQNLKARQEVGQRQLESLEDERQNVLKKITITQRHLAQLPIREQEMTSLTRDYEITKAHYQSLMDKQLAAGMATEMERRQKSERFTMLDAARVPDQPVKPNRPLYCALGSALGLILGLTISLGVESKRNVLLGEWELPREIVVLGQVPRIRMATSYGSDSAGAHKAGLRLVLRNRYLLLTFFGILLLILGIWIGVNFRWLSQWVASVK